MNGQIVVCPGWNDGDQLRRTLRDLTEWQFSSCSLVPVGITKYRQGLAKLRPVDRDCARDIIAIAEEFGLENLRRFGTRRFFCADELFLRAGMELPQEDYYEGYRQLENGVGMLRSLEQDFLSAMRLEDHDEAPAPFTVATGTAAAPFMRYLLEQASAWFPALRGQVIAVENDFFGHTIDVAGLLTGRICRRSIKRSRIWAGCAARAYAAARRKRIFGRLHRGAAQRRVGLPGADRGDRRRRPLGRHAG